MSLKPCCVLTPNHHEHKHKLTLAQIMRSLTHHEGPERSSLWRALLLRDLTVSAPASPCLGAGANTELPAPRSRACIYTCACTHICPTQTSRLSASYALGTPSRLVLPYIHPAFNSIPKVCMEACPASTYMYWVCVARFW